MNSSHNNGKNNRSSGDQTSGDQTLDDGLNQLDQLYRSEEPEGPPDLLDQAILNKAKRAVEPTNGWLDFGWIHGATTVALIVLSFSIITFQRETGELDADDYPSTKSRAETPASQITSTSSDSTDSPSSGRLSSGQSAKRLSNKASDQLSTQEIETDQRMSDQASISKDDFTVSPLSAPPAMPAKEEFQADPRSRDQDSPQPQMSAPASSEVLQENKQSEGLMQRVEETQRAKEAQNADEVQSAEALRNAQEERIMESAQLESLDAVVDAPELEMPSAAGQQQLMLDQILALKNAGDESWLEKLNAFKELYPDFPLPEELENKDE